VGTLDHGGKQYAHAGNYRFGAGSLVWRASRTPPMSSERESRHGGGAILPHPPMSSERESRHGGGAILPNIIARLLESVEEKISKSYIAI
jgi:hypothetical protein